MSAYPVQVEDAMWIVPLNLVLVPDEVDEPQADITRATRMNRGRIDRFRNMESPPRADSAPMRRGFGGACRAASPYATRCGGAAVDEAGRRHRDRRRRTSWAFAESRARGRECRPRRSRAGPGRRDLAWALGQLLPRHSQLDGPTAR